MEIVRGLTRTAHLLGASSLAFLLVGCAEQRPTAPENAKVLDISSKPTFTATVANQITLYGKDGKAQVFNETQNVNVNFKGGLGRATVTPQLKKITATLDTSVPNGVTPDGTVVTPVLALLSGLLAANYDQTTVDSVSNVVHLVSTGPAGTTVPITDSYSYENGVLTGWNHSAWTAVTGGYVLRYQDLRGYAPNGTLTGEILSVISTAPKPVLTFRASLGAKFAALSWMTVDKVACALTPRSAFAQSSYCWFETAKFAVETGLLMGAIGAFAAIPEVSAMFTLAAQTAAVARAGTIFIGAFAVYTHAMYDMLDCIDKARRPAPRL